MFLNYYEVYILLEIGKQWETRTKCVCILWHTYFNVDLLILLNLIFSWNKQALLLVLNKHEWMNEWMNERTNSRIRNNLLIVSTITPLRHQADKHVRVVSLKYHIALSQSPIYYNEESDGTKRSEFYRHPTSMQMKALDKTLEFSKPQFYCD